jgi:hypothetical protein
LVTVTVCAALLTFNGLLNVNEVGKTELIGAIPLPLRDTVSVGALLVIVTVPVLAPLEAGLNLSVSVQFRPAARVAPQPFVNLKSAPARVTTMLVSVVEPVLVRVAVWAGLVEFTS